MGTCFTVKQNPHVEIQQFKPSQVINSVNVITWNGMHLEGTKLENVGQMQFLTNLGNNNQQQPYVLFL